MIAALTQQQQQSFLQKQAGQGCKKSHLVGACEMFKKLTLEKKLAKMQEERLCPYCIRHRADQECFGRNDPKYKGCE